MAGFQPFMVECLRNGVCLLKYHQLSRWQDERG